MNTATYLIPDCNLPELEARVVKLNRRAAKLGVAPIVLTKQPDHIKYQVRQTQSGQEINGPLTRLVWRKSIEKNPLATAALPFEPTGEVMTWWSVTVTGETPTYNGWSFIAVLEPLATEDGEVLNLIQTVPGETCPVEYKNTIGTCDHCRAIRRRKQTFVVRHTDGSYKVVGRQCIKDFLGYNGDPHGLAAAAEMIAELGELFGSAEDEDWLEGGGFGRVRAWELKHFLTLTACRVRLFGWLGRGKAREDAERGIRGGQATADAVLEILNPPSGGFGYQEWKEFVAKHVKTDADVTEAEAAIEWAKELPVAEIDGDNNYLSNVNLVARVGAVNGKTAGIAASIVIAYQKAMEREINRQQRAARPASEHVGTVGKRIKDMTVTCDKVIMHEGIYGVTGIHKMHDAAGNDLVWFSSKGLVIDEGETVAIAGTVKEHGEFNGRKQTVLTRVKVSEKVEA